MTATIENAYLVDPAVQDVFDGHTAYTFDPTPLPANTLETLWELVKNGPTAYNTHPLRIYAVTGEAKQRLIGHLMEGNRARTEIAPLTVIIAADTNFHDELPRTFPVFPGARDIFLDDTMRTNVAQAQAWLQLGYFILGVRALGLAAGPMNGMDVNGINNDLLAGTGHTALAVVNIGYPGENAFTPRNPRLEANEVITHLN